MKIILFTSLLLWLAPAFGQDIVSICKSNGLSQAATVQKVLERNWNVSQASNPYILSLVKQKTGLQDELDTIRRVQAGILASPAKMDYLHSLYEGSQQTQNDYDNANIKHHEEAIAKIDAAIKSQEDLFFKANQTNVEKFVASKY